MALTKDLPRVYLREPDEGDMWSGLDGRQLQNWLDNGPYPPEVLPSAMTLRLLIRAVQHGVMYKGQYDKTLGVGGHRGKKMSEHCRKVLGVEIEPDHPLWILSTILVYHLKQIRDEGIPPDSATIDHALEYMKFDSKLHRIPDLERLKRGLFRHGGSGKPPIPAPEELVVDAQIYSFRSDEEEAG